LQENDRSVLESGAAPDPPNAGALSSGRAPCGPVGLGAAPSSMRPAITRLSCGAVSLGDGIRLFHRLSIASCAVGSNSDAACADRSRHSIPQPGRPRRMSARARAFLWSMFCRQITPDSGAPVARSMRASDA